MKFIRHLFLLIASSLFLYACQTTTSETTAKKNLEIGDSFDYYFKMENETTIGIKEQELTTLLKEEDRYNFEVKDITEEGNTVVDFTINFIETSTSNSMDGVPIGEAVSFNSEATEESENPSVTFLQKIVNQPNKVTYDKQGNILSIKGLEERIDTLFKEVTTPGAQQFRAQMQGLFNEEKMKLQLEELSGYAIQEKNIGDSWEEKKTVSVNSNMNTQVNRTFTLKDRKDGKAFLDLRGTVLVNPDAKLNMGTMSFRYDIKGTLTGEIIVDEKNGWVASSTIQQIMSGKMTALGAGFGGEETGNFYSKINSEAKRN